MTKNITEDTLNRLAHAIMLRHSVGYEDALSLLSKFRLNLVCHPSVAQSQSFQAALLTAVNCGKRAFHGGVYLSAPENLPCPLPWPRHRSLNEIAFSLGAQLLPVDDSPFTQTLYFGPAQDPRPDSYEVVCSGWRGGIAPAERPIQISDQHDFALGGVLAGALGVARGFLRIAGLTSRDISDSQGYSLWRPDLPWTDPVSAGPPLESLPKSLWMLGLGHLGQGYLWNFSLLPYEDPKGATFLLQDFDQTVEGNFSSGMLCEARNVGRKKTRICSDWLELRGFSTTICERKFDATIMRSEDEPFIACCGFDSVDARRALEFTGFDLIVECGLGADPSRFDRMTLHTFPGASKKPTEIWISASPIAPAQRIVEAFRSKEDCGILAETLARKAVSTSFVGAFAGAFVVGEILRALHGGVRAEKIQAHMRHAELPGVILKNETYMNRVARSGFCSVSRIRNTAA